MTKSSKAMLIASGLFAIAGGSASAEKTVTVTAQSPTTERVPYTVADLAGDRAIRNLQRRVRSAAHRVCAPDEDTFMPTYIELRCYGPTVEDALAQVERAVERQHSGAALAMSSVIVTAR